MSVFNVFYNSVKSISEIKNWAFLSDYQKREKIFGDLFVFIDLINKNTKNKSEILIIAKDEMPFYLSRYFLFPKKVYRQDSLNIAQIDKEKKYQYIAVYNQEVELKNYRQIKMFKSENEKNFGILFKIK